MKGILKKIKCQATEKKHGQKMEAHLKENSSRIRSKGPASKRGRMEAITKECCRTVFSTAKENTTLLSNRKHTLDPLLTARWKARAGKYGLMEENTSEISSKE